MTDTTNESESTLDSRLEKLAVTNAPDELKELATLKDQGVLTEEEFSAQKAKILAQLS